MTTTPSPKGECFAAVIRGMPDLPEKPTDGMWLAAFERIWNTAYREGRRDGINETYHNAQRQLRGDAVLVPHAT
jgi:hypothetical protein